MCVALGGRLAEEIINGKDNVTTGASNDFQQCVLALTPMTLIVADGLGYQRIEGWMDSMDSILFQSVWKWFMTALFKHTGVDRAEICSEKINMYCK